MALKWPSISPRLTHRSWWIARNAIADYKRDGRKHYFLMDNGLKVPISQSNLQKLRDAQLIDAQLIDAQLIDAKLID